MQYDGLFSELIGGSVAGEADIAMVQSDDSNACNTFESLRILVPVYEKLMLGAQITVTLPAASVMAITVKLSDK